MSEPIVVSLPNKEPIEINLISPLNIESSITNPVINTTLVEPDLALQLHSVKKEKGFHIPLNGISDNEIDSISINKITNLENRLSDIENNALKFIFTLVDLNSENYYYYGGSRNDGVWKINRVSKNNLEESSALISANSAYSTLAEAWEVRSTLTYMVG